MSICHERRLIFVHIPKNAGTSIHSLFDTNSKDYLPDQKWIEYKKHFKEYWNSYKSFSILRDPVSRFISIYKYSILNRLVPEGIDFFLENLNSFNYTFKKPQSWFIVENRKIMVDYIIRYENLIKDLKKIGIDSIPHENKTPSYNLTLNENQIKKIKQIYKEDYNLLENASTISLMDI